MDLLVGSVRRLSESRKKSRSLPLNTKGFPPGFTLASFEDDGSSSYSEQIPKSKVKRKRGTSCLPLPSSSIRSSSDDGEIGEGGTSNSDTSCSSVEFLRVPTRKQRDAAFGEIWSETRQTNVVAPRQSESVPSKLDLVKNNSSESLSRKERLEALKARIAAERERIRDSSDDERDVLLTPKLSMWRFHSDEALNRTSKPSANKTRAARTERYLKRKSQEDISIKHVTLSDPNLDFLEYSSPSWYTNEKIPDAKPTVVNVTPKPQEHTVPAKSSSLSWNESNAYEEPRRASDSSNYNSALESCKEGFNLPKKNSKMSNAFSPQHHLGHGHNFLPNRKPSPLTVKTVFGSPFNMAHPSPCDSGLSSQSMASSPSIGRAPTPPPRITKGGLLGDPYGGSNQPRIASPLSRPQRPVSCALPSSSEHLYGRIISRSPTSTLLSECSSSGRSSPWWNRVPSSSSKPPPHSPVKATVSAKSPLYYYTDVPPGSKTPQLYSYTDQAPDVKSSESTTSAYMSDSQIDSKKYQPTKLIGPSPNLLNKATPETRNESYLGNAHERLSIPSPAKPSFAVSYPGLRSPPIQNGRPLSMVLEKSESLESSINNSVSSRPSVSENGKMAPPTPPRKITPNGDSTPKFFDMSSEEKDKRRRTSANFEDALQELEEIYQSLGLNDEDLLDRAERRDLPTVHQLKRFSIADPTALQMNGFPLSRSSSEGFGRPWLHETSHRTPPNRRSAIPDKVSDDLAIRRLQRTVSGPTRSKSPGGPGTDINQSYLQCSPGLTPTSKTNGFFNDAVKNDEPDVNLDDVTYRMYSQADSTKVPPPHPPFGIPLEPISKCSTNDYLHATPSDDEDKRIKNFYKPQPNPDVVRDDMAFRNLRRERKGSLTNGIGNALDAACREVESWRKPPAKRKDRAIKSLSANMESAFDSIANFAPVDNDKAQSMSDLIAALEQESRKWDAFVRDTEVAKASLKESQGSSTETLTEIYPAKEPPKTIVFPEPIKGKHGAIYSLMCLSDLKKRKESKESGKELEKSKSPPPVPKRTSTVVLTKRPPHPKGFWSDSETKSFSSGFGDGSLDDLLSSLTRAGKEDASTTSEVKGELHGVSVKA